MTQHTPTPWKLILPIVEPEGEETDEGGQVAIHMGDRLYSSGCFSVGNEIILDEGCCPGDNKVAEANAAFIVKAVNNHEQLVKALKDCEELLSAICEVVCAWNPPPHSIERLAKAREVLAAAEGGA